MLSFFDRCVSHISSVFTISMEILKTYFAMVVDHPDSNFWVDLKDFFPKFPKKVNRTAWVQFDNWIYHGRGQELWVFCKFWRTYALKCLQKCHVCRECSATSEMHVMYKNAWRSRFLNLPDSESKKEMMQKLPFCFDEWRSPLQKIRGCVGLDETCFRYDDEDDFDILFMVDGDDGCGRRRISVDGDDGGCSCCAGLAPQSLDVSVVADGSEMVDIGTRENRIFEEGESSAAVEKADDPCKKQKFMAGDEDDDVVKKKVKQL